MKLHIEPDHAEFRWHHPHRHIRLKGHPQRYRLVLHLKGIGAIPGPWETKRQVQHDVGMLKAGYYVLRGR